MPEKVEVYVYDLAMGMAKQFSGFVGFQLEGIWHTAVVCFGREWFFGGGGVESCMPGGTMLGQPLRVLQQGETKLTSEAFLDYLRGLKQDRFRGDRYSLLDHNCNNFSDEVSKFLTGQGLPDYILDLPQKVKQSPVAPILAPLIEQATPRGHDIGENYSGGASSSVPTYQHFPLREYVTFKKSIDADKFKEKVAELANKHATRLPSSETVQQVITTIVGMTTQASNWTSFSGTLWPRTKQLLLSWPREDIFPLLDGLRYATAHASMPEAVTREILDLVTGLLVPESPHTVLQLSLKIVCNVFAHDLSRRLALSCREDLVGRCNAILEETQGRPSILEVTLATVPLNLTVYWTLKEEGKSAESEEDKEGKVQVLSSLATAYLGEGGAGVKAPEAAYRAMVALGALAHSPGSSSEVKELARALEVASAAAAAAKRVKEAASSDRGSSGGVGKVQECADEIGRVMS